MRVDGVVAAVGVAEPEGAFEVLGHGAHVAHSPRVALVRPGGYGEPAHRVENGERIHGRDVAFQRAIADAERSAPLRTRGLIGCGRVADRPAADRALRIAAKLTYRTAFRTAARSASAS